MTTIAERHPPAARFSTAARFRGWLRNPWGRPRFLIVFTWAYILWSIVPVLIAVQFSFNATRSRTIWDSFSTRWYWGDPVDSVWHDPTLRHALVQTFKLAGAEYPVDADGAARELKDALAQLFPERGDQRLDELLRKQAREGLTRAERTELQGFLTRPQGAQESAHTQAGQRT